MVETNNAASMSAARNPSKTAPPTTERDGFSLISRRPIVYDIDITAQHNNNKNEIHNFNFQDITCHISTSDQCARIAFARPHVLHAFRPRTIREIQIALDYVTNHVDVAVIILTSNIDRKIVTPAFCVGGDQRVRSDNGGYQDGTETQPKLRVLDLQIQMRRCPKPILCVVQGYAIGGGHILHMLADLTLASDDAIFGQTGPRVGSFDAGYGCTRMARLIGQKRAREMWFTCRFVSAKEALSWGLINAVYPPDELEGRVAQWVRRMSPQMTSPTALASCKAALNADEEGAAGIAQLGGEMTRLFYTTPEAREGRDAFLQRRAPQFASQL